MKTGLTEIVVVLDESGSMSSCKGDTIGGFNVFLSSQQKIKGSANMTFVKFSDYYNKINDGIDINEVVPLNESTYTPSFSTALLDAVGKTINDVGNRLSSTPESERPEKVIFTVITDGYENTSKEFTKRQISEMIKHQREKYSWEFLFLGADIDAWGQEIGIMTNVNINKNDLTRSMKSMSYYTANYRVGSDALGVNNFNLSNEVLDAELENLYDKDKKTKK